MGRTTLSQSIEIQNLAKSLFSNVDLVWKYGFMHGSQNKVVIEPHTSPMLMSLNFYKMNDMQIAIEWNIFNNLSLQQGVKKPTINNHLGHTWYGFKTYKPFPLVIFTSSKVSRTCVFWFDCMETMFGKYECSYGLEDQHKDPNHMRSIKHNCLAHFSIKRLYTRPDVVEITFYHWIHIQANGDLVHNACDLGSTS